MFLIIIFKICVFNKDVFVNNFGYEFVEVIGYVNKDNDDSVIFELEKICVGDLLDDGVIVVINGCSNWYGFFLNFYFLKFKFISLMILYIDMRFLY